jgi:origin recognition complex subunit 4
MASLLALLSHPSEILGTDEGVTSQSIVFIIDEFDMFASHPRQTLLYNLFDIAQSRKAPIAVLGCTTRLDVVEMLEKRVKSRFSHRYVYLSLPKSLPAYWQVCRQGLIVERSDLKKEGIDASLEGYDEFHRYWTHKIEVSGVDGGMWATTILTGECCRTCTSSDLSKICSSTTTTRQSRRRPSSRSGCCLCRHCR